jgi:hypothetical protein
LFSAVLAVVAGLSPLPAAATGPSHEFREAVERGQRSRLHEQAFNATPLETFLAGTADNGHSIVTQQFGDDSAAALRLFAYRALAASDVPTLIRAATRWSGCSTGAAAFEAQLLLAQAELLAGHPDESAQRADWISRQATEPWKGYGLYAQGQAALAAQDTAEAIRLFKMCTRRSGQEVSGQAYLQLGRLCEARGESSQAVSYLTVYREAFPNGLLPAVETAPAASARADRLAGVEYSVQVGVFGDRANAEKQRHRFSSTKWPVELVPKTVAGQKYTAVWVGRFKTQNDAQEARKSLEEQFSETYRVVARE